MMTNLVVAEEDCEYNTDVLQQPILVGYAFGPKKMSTMGVVMAEASKALMKSSCMVTIDGNHEISNAHKGMPSLTSHALQQLHETSKQTTLSIHHSGGGLQSIVRFFQSNCSSVGGNTTTEGDDSTERRAPSSTASSTARTTALSHPTIRVSFVPLDLNEPLEEQHGGNFDIILHKMTEDILCLSTSSPEHQKLVKHPRVDEDDNTQGPVDLPLQQALSRIQRLNQYSETSHCCLVDHPSNIQVVMNRYDIAMTLAKCLVDIRSTSGMVVTTPKFKLSSSPRTLRYPLIVKPLTAAGTKKSHCMKIVLRPDGLEETGEEFLQEYANHNALLYKVYVLGENIFVYERPSLPNLPETTAELVQLPKPSVEFDSQRPYPTSQDFGLRFHGEQSKEQTMTPLTSNEVLPVVNSLKRAFGLELFGFDILRSLENKLLVVDVNYFPSYKEVAKFPSLLAQYLTQRALQARKEKNRSRPKS